MRGEGEKRQSAKLEEARNFSGKTPVRRGRIKRQKKKKEKKRKNKKKKKTPRNLILDGALAPGRRR